MSNNTQREPASADEAVERYAEEHAAEWQREEQPVPTQGPIDLADYIFETLTAQNRALAKFYRTQQ